MGSAGAEGRKRRHHRCGRFAATTSPLVFAELTSHLVEEARAKGIDKPVVASLAGDTEVERASDYLFDHRIFAYPYTTERLVAMLGAKYGWARADGLDPTAAGTAQPAAGQLSGTRPEHPPTEEGNNKGVRTSRPLKEVKR